jgi:hypothetical protein
MYSRYVTSCSHGQQQVLEEWQRDNSNANDTSSSTNTSCEYSVYQSVTDASQYSRCKRRQVLTATTASVGDVPGVFEKRSLLRTERRSHPVALSFGKLLLGYVDVQGIALGVNGDDIAVLNKGNRTSDLSLGDNVTDHKAVRSIQSALSTRTRLTLR